MEMFHVKHLFGKPFSVRETAMQGLACRERKLASGGLIYSSYWKCSPPKIGVSRGLVFHGMHPAELALTFMLLMKRPHLPRYEWPDNGRRT